MDQTELIISGICLLVLLGAHALLRLLIVLIVQLLKRK